MKIAAPLAKNILAPSGITAAASAMDAGIQKNTWFRNNNFNNFKRRKEWHNEICLSSSRFSFFADRGNQEVGELSWMSHNVSFCSFL